jgi:hypothetical protein
VRRHFLSVLQRAAVGKVSGDAGRPERMIADRAQAAQSCLGSNEYPLHLVEAHLVAAAVVKLRRARRGVVRHGSGLFERPAVLQIGGDAGRAEAVIPDFRRNTGGDRAPPDHGIGIGLGQGGQGELARASAYRAKQQALRVIR